MDKASTEKFYNTYIGKLAGRDHPNRFLEMSKQIGKDNDGCYQHDQY